MGAELDAYAESTDRDRAEACSPFSCLCQPYTTFPEVNTSCYGADVLPGGVEAFHLPLAHKQSKDAIGEIVL